MAKPIQYCKVISLQLNKFILKKKKHMLKREGVLCHLKERVLFYTMGTWSQVCQENAPLAFGRKVLGQRAAGIRRSRGSCVVPPALVMGQQIPRK